jgi:hypothetical protein
VHGRRGLIAAGIAVIALTGVVVAALLSGGGGGSSNTGTGFKIDRGHPGAGGGAGVAAGGISQLQGAQMHPLWSDQTIEQTDQELDLLKAAGGDVVRIDLTWTSLETWVKGEYSQWYLDKADAFLQHAKDRGIAVVATLLGTPCWASTAPEDLKQGCSGAWWDRGVERYPPADYANYGDIADYVAKRWGSKLKAIEIWNEPNLPDHYSLQSDDPAAADASLIKAAYPRIKAAAPSVTVLAGALAYSDGDFLEKLYDDGIKDNFDGFSIHPYNEWRDPKDAWKPEFREWTYLTGPPWMQSILAAHGDGEKGLWLTELGWSSCLPGGNDSWCVTQEQQAQYVHDALQIAAGWPFVKAAVIYNLRNTGTDPNDRESQFGLVNRDFTLKPSYASFKNALTGPLPSTTETTTTSTSTSPTTSPTTTAPSAGNTEPSIARPAKPDVARPPNTVSPEAAPLPFAVQVQGVIPPVATPKPVSSVGVKIRCQPAAEKRCKGKLQLRSRGGALLATGGFDLRPGLATMRPKLTTAGRRALKRGHAAKVVATVTSARGVLILRVLVR